jgi:hypothetical protein
LTKAIFGLTAKRALVRITPRHAFGSAPSARNSERGEIRIALQ